MGKCPIQKPGTNHLEIAVTNEWTNRQAGDRLLPAEQRILSGPLPPTRPGTAPALLPESGLLGDVSFFAETP